MAHTAFKLAKVAGVAKSVRISQFRAPDSVRLLLKELPT